MEVDVTQKLLFHMKWANQVLFRFLLDADDDIYNLTAWDRGWSIHKIVNHLVVAQDRYVSRLSGLHTIEDKWEPCTKAGMQNLATRSLKNDEKLINLASIENKLLSFNQNGNVVNFHASTVLAQSIHHATEHRAQIDDILSFKGAVNLNLDSIDIWSFDRQINREKF